MTRKRIRKERNEKGNGGSEGKKRRQGKKEKERRGTERIREPCKSKGREKEG